MGLDQTTDYLGDELLDRLIQRSPMDALEHTRAAIANADDAAIAAEHWLAIGRSCFELGRSDLAVEAVHEALALCRSTRDIGRLAPLVLSASAVLAEHGDIEAAMLELARIEPLAPAGLQGRIAIQRAFVLHHAGRLEAALAETARAEGLVRDSGDDAALVRLHINRGLVLLQLGDLAEAEDDFLTADRMALELGYTAQRALVAANLGVLRGRARRFREALADFDRARELHAACGNPARTVAIMEIDLAEVAIHLGLAATAVEAAREALRNALETRNRVLVGDSRLVLAKALLGAGQHEQARRAAEAAHAELVDCGRSESAAGASAVELMAALAVVDDEQLDAVTSRAADVVDELERHGWARQADDLRIARVQAALRLGRVGSAADDLARLRLGAFSPRRDHLLAGWYCEAVSRSLAGDLDHALDACRAGLDVLDEIVGEAPTLEARSAAMSLGAHLSQLAIRYAIALDDAVTVLAAAEGTRARALHHELADRRPHQPLTAVGAARMLADLDCQLADRVLVEFVLDGPEAWAVAHSAGETRLVALGDVRSIVRARDRVLVWLDRANLEPDVSNAGAIRAIGVLDGLLAAPLTDARALSPGSGVVIVPDDLFHGIPWSGLPSLAGRDVVLAPNAQVWLAADRRAAESISTVAMVAGPGVERVEIEREAVVAHHPDASILEGSAAGAASVRALLERTGLLHLAAHGTFRSDHPLLSTLLLDGAPATLYDIVPDRVATQLVMLSSCEGGAHGTSDGSEVLGMSAVLLARGAVAVLAPLTVVRELECADFVAELHGELAAGRPLGAAVAGVRERWLAADDLSRWAVASSFTCFGSGAVRLAPIAARRQTG